MKKLMKPVLVFTLIIQLIAVATWTQQVYAAPGDSPDNPIIITTAEQLSAIRDNLSAHYRLGADIDLSGFDMEGGGWLPIGATTVNTTYPFTGSLDGNGYTIRNMKIHFPTLKNAGLFGSMEGDALLRNVRLQDIHIVAESNVGGLVGLQSGGRIENSYATGSLRSVGPYLIAENAGGLTGMLGMYGTIEGSYAVVDVEGLDRVGGLVGNNYGTIKNSYAAGRVYAINKEVGGLVGANSRYIVNSYAAGTVNGNSFVGGLVGLNDNDDMLHLGIATDSYWNMDTTNQAYSPVGSGLTSEEMKQASSFGWDPSVWGIIEGTTYPYLRAFGMGIGVDPLALTTYSLEPGQDAVSVTGSVYHETANEAIDIRYVIRDSSGDAVTEETQATDNSDAIRSINRRFPLSGYADGYYTITVLATDSHGTQVGNTFAFKV